MKKIVTLLFIVVCAQLAKAQTCEDFAVELKATVQATPPKITLDWKKIADTTAYYVYKKAKTTLAWPTTPIATFTTNDSTFSDTAVVVDSAYEYQLVGVHHNGAVSWTAFGYIYAGIKCPAIHSKGGLIVLVDSTYSDSCSFELHRYMKDASADGWQVFRHDVPRSMPDTVVKAIIKNDYNTHANVKAVQILGHVAVPYSGDLNPDGHPDHLGAWPADIFYGQLSATFTDASINDVASPYTFTQNAPGDGKWDQTQMTSRAELQVGRVDVSNMPAFSPTEVQLMLSYLNKDHIFKMDSLAIRKRALVSDNFGVFNVVSAGVTYYEAFASSGWRSFAPLVSRDSVSAVTFIPSLNSGSYIWAYGCGGGSFSSCGGVGATSDFTTNNMNGIFTMLFGSYFGDWNVQNNFMRAPLCSAIPALTCCWSGRPYWIFHHMALGENIGYSAWHSQNNDGSNYGPASIYGMQQWVHMGFMGDLTLRMDYVKRISNLTVTPAFHHGATLNWTASPDASVIGYYVYRSDTGEYGNYKRISGVLTTTTFKDTVGKAGLKYYMVRPIKLQSTPSGVYNNLGLGISDSATVTYNTVSVPEIIAKLDCSVYPNPANNFINVSINIEAETQVTLSLLDISGRVVASAVKQIEPGANTYTMNVAELPAGVYSVVVNAGNSSVVRKWVKL